MDTIGSLVDKLITVDTKLWNSQEIVYEIRQLTEDEFLEKYASNLNGLKMFYKELNKATDLNVQRSKLVTEIDELLVTMIKATVLGYELDDGSFIQRPHKTYGDSE